MFTRVVALLPLALLASAATLEVRGNSGECATGPAQCCTSTTEGDMVAKYGSDSGLLSILADLLSSGSSFSDCSGGVVGVLGTCSAQQQPVCCNSNTFNDLIGINCSPINIVL